MKVIIQLLTQLIVTVEGMFHILKKTNFSVKINDKGNIIGYLRPDTGALYCSMSVSHFKHLLSTGEIPVQKISDKITLVRISDIDIYIEKKAKENS